MKFIHAADIHLGSGLPGFRLRTLGDLPPDADVVRLAFRRLVDLAIAEDAAFMIIAGDLYDGAWQDMSVGLFFGAEMARLRRPCFLLRGNHDALSVVGKAVALPPNVTIFGSERCETIRLDDLAVALHGHSFPHRAAPNDLSVHYCSAEPGLLNIGVLHTSAGGDAAHDTYAPCTVESLRARDYGYWALGHVHARRALHEDPWIIFPGNLQGRHARETGPKGCCVVHVEDRQVVRVEYRDLDVLRWAAVEVDAAGLSFVDLQRSIEDAVLVAFDEAEGRALAARLRIVGETDLHARLADDEEGVVQLAAVVAANHGQQLWLESVRIATRPLRERGTRSFATLGQRFREELAHARAGLASDIGKLRAALPERAREAADLPATDADFEALAEDAWSLVERRLSEEESP